MATITAGFECKTVGDTVPGELFRIQLRGQVATCVTLATTEGKNPLVGILAGGTFDRPAHFECSKNSKCISFGLNWVIDPIFGDESGPLQTNSNDDIDVLHIQDGDAFLRFDEANEPARSINMLYGSLTGSRLLDYTTNSVPFERWRIWLSAKDRERPGAEPFLSFPARSSSA